MAGSRATSVMSISNGGGVSGSSGPHNDSSSLSQPTCPPPPPQVPPPPLSTLDMERIRWAANPVPHPNFGDQLKQNIYAVSMLNIILGQTIKQSTLSFAI